MAKRKPEEESPGAVATEAPPLVSARNLWWFGMLPAKELVEWPVPTRDVDEATGDFFSIKKFDPLALWTMRAMKDVTFPIFVARLRQMNSLGAGGCAFNAFTNHVQALGEQLVHSPFPGDCKVMSDDEAKRIVEGCHRHFVEFSHGVEQRNSLACNATLWDSGDGAAPSGRQDNPFTMDLSAGQRKDFDSLTDIRISEFVYLARLDEDWRKWPPGEYRRCPAAFHKSVVPSMEEFFQRPPQSVAEMYPREA